MTEKPQEQIEQKTPKRHIFLRIFNFFLMFLISFLSFFVSIVLFSRESLVEMSEEFFDAPGLMKSTVLDYILHEEYVVFLVLIVIGMVVKEFKVKNLMNRIYINSGLLSCVFVYFVLLFYLMYRPIIMMHS